MPRSCFVNETHRKPKKEALWQQLQTGDEGGTSLLAAMKAVTPSPLGAAGAQGAAGLDFCPLRRPFVCFGLCCIGACVLRPR